MRRAKRLTRGVRNAPLGMAQGVGVEWVRTTQGGEGVAKPPEDLEAELKELLTRSHQLVVGKLSKRRQVALKL